MGIPLDACIVVDNSVLTMLTDFACTCQAGGLSGQACATAILKWVTEQLSIIQKLAPDAKIHCTDRVAREYKPENGPLASRPGVVGVHYRDLKNGVCSLLHVTCVDSQDIAFLKGLRGVPRKYAGKYGPGDNDLSLVALGLTLTAYGSKVYVLSNDQDLVGFITAVCKTHQQVRTRWPNSALVEGFHGMTYLQSAHAACYITNDQLLELLKFVMQDLFWRTAESYEASLGRSDKRILSPQKAKDIYRQLEGIMDAFIKSAQKKAIAAAMAGVP